MTQNELRILYFCALAVGIIYVLIRAQGRDEERRKRLEKIERAFDDLRDVTIELIDRHAR